MSSLSTYLSSPSSSILHPSIYLLTYPTRNLRRSNVEDELSHQSPQSTDPITQSPLMRKEIEI